MVVWLCHARVGHRQGLYPDQPSPETVGVFLCLVVAPQAPPAAGHRLELYRDLTLARNGGVFLCRNARCARTLGHRPVLIQEGLPQRRPRLYGRRCGQAAAWLTDSVNTGYRMSMEVEFGSSPSLRIAPCAAGHLASAAARNGRSARLRPTAAACGRSRYASCRWLPGTGNPARNRTGRETGRRILRR